MTGRAAARGWAGLLLLADSRLPSGGHGHSGGVEALVDRGLLQTVADLALFLHGRLRTGGLLPAAAAASSCAVAGLAVPEPQQGGFTAAPLQQGGFTAAPLEQGHRAATPGPAEPAARRTCEPAVWARWDAAVSVRMPSSAARAASRAQGAALLRTVSTAWPGTAVSALRALPSVHHPLVLGAAAHAVGATPEQAATLALHHVIGGACTAAVRLLGLDPIAVAAVAAAAGRIAEPIAADATRSATLAVADADPDLLPVDGSPLQDVLAQLHHTSEATLFAS